LRRDRGEAGGRPAGVRRAAVNFAVGRLDAEHDPGLSMEEIERAVVGAGYRVART
jgi:Cd2+/Zn2+-exporting ATPase